MNKILYNYYNVGVILLTILIFISLHLKLFMVGAFGASLSLFLIPFWVYKIYKIKFGSFNQNEISIFFLVCCIPFLPLNISLWEEFFNTYMQYFISAYFVVRTYKKSVRVSYKLLDYTLWLIQIIILIVVLIQFISLNFYGIKEFYNIFGNLQLYYELSPELGKFRMKAFYLEPSYLGLVIVNLFWCRLYIHHQRNLFSINLIISILILFFVQSSFANVSISIMIIYYLKNEYFKKYRIFFYFGLIILLGISSSFLLDAFRFNEFRIENTSGFFRMILPFEVLKELFVHGHYFGLTFGQLEVITEKIYGHYGAGTALSNSFFLILGYFGLLGILFYILLFIRGSKTNNAVLSSFILLTFLNLNNSGAFMTLQYVFVTILLPTIVIKLNEQKIINNYRS